MSILGGFYLSHPSACVNSVAQSLVIVMCNRSMRIVCLLSLLCSLVEVHSQTFPRLSFMGQTLANNSYVDISQVGRPNIPDGGESVQCITDLSTCCTNGQGFHRGDWYFPNGDRLPFNAPDVGIFEFRGSQRVDIRRRNNANSPTGIYHCDVPTNAVHDDSDISVSDTVYVGLYTGSGGRCNIVGKSFASSIIHASFAFWCTFSPCTTLLPPIFHYTCHVLLSNLFCYKCVH